MEVASVPGQGTTFKILLPAATKEIAEPAEAENKVPLRGRETILLVEDETSLRVSLARNLRRLGYRVLEADHGPAAIAVWQEHSGQVDLLFSDMIMPEGLTGLDLAERFQAEKPGLKVVISSGYHDEFAGPAKSAARGFMFLQKPHHLLELSQTIRNCLDQE